MIGQAEVGRRAGALAIAIGLIAIGAVVCLGLFYIVGGPLGAINDVGNALIGILSALLAVELRGVARTGWVAIAATVVGAALTVIGSALVMSGTTGRNTAAFNRWSPGAVRIRVVTRLSAEDCERRRGGGIVCPFKDLRKWGFLHALGTRGDTAGVCGLH